MLYWAGIGTIAKVINTVVKTRGLLNQLPVPFISVTPGGGLMISLRAHFRKWSLTPFLVTSL